MTILSFLVACAPARRPPESPAATKPTKTRATAATGPAAATSEREPLWPGAGASSGDHPEQRAGEGRLPSAFARGRSTTATSGSPRVDFELYVMSQCPFGTQVERALKKAYDKIGDHVKLRIDYIVNERNGKFTALHGPDEVDGNIIELCVMSYYSKPSDYLQFLDCHNDDFRAIPRRWKQCARRSNMDVAQLTRCFIGEGKQLLRASMARTRAANANGSPTIVIGGKRYQGARSARDLIAAVCGNFSKADAPPVCGSLPSPVTVSLTVLNDKRCRKCPTTGLINNLRNRFFPKMTIKHLDYGSAEGRSLFQSLGLKHLPAYLFGAEVQQAASYSRISRWMSSKGSYFQLTVPAKFDPTAEICDNGIDDTGNGHVDCADPTCTIKLVCRPIKKRQVDLFVMSKCPYANKALPAMKQVLRDLPQIDFRIHYIVDKKPDGSFSALHGQAAVDENLRQLCARKLFGRRNRYLRYIWCRSENYRSDNWKPCA